MKRSRHATIVCLAAALALVKPVRAESGATLAAAEKAYAEVDFEAAHELALSALKSGGHEPAETKRLYALLGISAAALENEDEARSAFRHLLAIDPTIRLDQNLSPKMRAPYLEARGALSSSGQIQPLDVRLERDGKSWTITLRDPGDVAKSVALELVAEGLSGPYKRSLPAEPRTPLAESERWPARFSYTLGARDAHGNWLFRARSEVSPPAVAGPPAPAVAARTAREPTDKAPPERAPYFITAGVLATLGMGAVSAGVVAQLRRDDAAEEWNSDACEVPGQTRGEQCSDVDARREKAENWAIGLYATGGALLVGSLFTLVLTPDTTSERATRAGLSCQPSLGFDGRFGAACRASF